MRSVATLCLTVVMFALTGSAFAQDGPIKYRQGVMKAIGGHAGAIAQIAYGGVDHGGHLADHANAFAALTKMVGASALARQRVNIHIPALATL